MWIGAQRRTPFPSPVTWRSVLIASRTGVLCDVVGILSTRKPQQLQWCRGSYNPAMPSCLAAAYAALLAVSVRGCITLSASGASCVT